MLNGGIFMRKTPAERLKTERIMTVMQAAFAFIGAIFVASLIFSAIATVVDLSDSTFMLMSSLALCAGCFSASYTAAKRRQRNGLKVGFICGAAIFFAVLLCGTIFVRSFSAGGFFTKLLIILVCSLAGGIIGVNSPRRFR